MSAFDPSRRALLCALLGSFGLIVLASVRGASAQDEDAIAKVAVKGRLVGGEHLLNAVWNEAKDPKNHRYSFRQPSATVGKKAKALTAYLPKELCIVALGEGAAPKSQPVQLFVSGGRTTPVTIVIADGQNVQFVNEDPFPHKLYDTGKVQGGLGPEDTKPSGQRIWKPPKAGVYEIKDKYFPSIRTWIVVEPRAVGFGFPKLTDPSEFVVPDLAPGAYELRAYFMGKPTGKPLKIDVRPTPDLQQIPQQLVVAEAKKSG